MSNLLTHYMKIGVSVGEIRPFSIEYLPADGTLKPGESRYPTDRTSEGMMEEGDYELIVNPDMQQLVTGDDKYEERVPNAETLITWLEEWRNTLSDSGKEESWGTERELIGYGGARFVEWVRKTKLT